MVSMGVYVLEPAALDYIEPGAVPRPSRPRRCGCSPRAARWASYLYDGYWLDIGRHEDYEKAI